MPPVARICFAAVVFAAAPGLALAQSKSITFGTPGNPNALNIRLVDDQPVTIGTTGNLSARCVANAAQNACADVPAGGGGGSNPATASLQGSIPTGSTGITPGSTLQLTPQSNGEVCLRRSTPATSWGTTLFGSPLVKPFGSASTVTLSLANTPYVFDLQCYGEGGASAIQTWTVTTGAGGGGGGANCSGVSPPPGFTRSNITSFSQLVTTSGGNPQPFPNSGSSFAALGQNTNQYTSIAFTVPAAPSCNPLAAPACRLGEFDWNSINLVNFLNVENSYVTVSECPGDFRIPLTGTAPVTDPTFSQGCRNWRNRFGGGFTSDTLLAWQIFGSAEYVPSPQDICNLEAGKTYYFNLILDGPADGVINIAGTANGCDNPSETFCGMGLLYYWF